MQVGGTGGADFQLVNTGAVGTSIVGGGDASGAALGSTLPTTSVVGGSHQGAPIGSSLPSSVPTMIPFAQPAAAPTANAGAANGAAAQQRIQGLLAGTIAPTAQEKPLVDSIRLSQQRGTAAAPAAAATGTGAETNAFEQRVLQLVNAERAANGLGPVSYHGTLDRAATGHNAQQAATRTMAHEGIGDGTPEDRALAVGWTDSWGENVAVGQTSPEQVVAEWMASPGHRRNILDPAYTKMGVSYTTDAGGSPYWAQTFGA